MKNKITSKGQVKEPEEWFDKNFEKYDRSKSSDMGSELHVFYKKHGIRIPMKFHDEVLLPYLHANMNEHLKKENQEAYFDQLETIIKEWDILGENYSDKIGQSLFIMNVFVLTSIGIIKDDEYNGLQYCYIQNNSLKIIF